MTGRPFISTLSACTSTRYYGRNVGQLLPNSDLKMWRCLFLFVCYLWRCGPTRAVTSSFLRFLDHTQRRTTVGRTPLDEWSARRRDLYLTTHNTHNRQTSVPPVGFEPTISAGERPQTYSLDRAATGTGRILARTPNILTFTIFISHVRQTSWLWCFASFHIPFKL